MFQMRIKQKLAFKTCKLTLLGYFEVPCSSIYQCITVRQRTARYPFVHSSALYLWTFFSPYFTLVTIFMLHFFRVTLFFCCILVSCIVSMLHFFQCYNFSCCTLFVLQLFRVALFSSCTCFMFHLCMLHVVCFSCCFHFVLHFF